MNHSKNFEKIKGFYDKGLWSIERVRAVVGKALGITEAEFTEITGMPYEA